MTKTDLREYSKSTMESEITDPLELLKSLAAHLNGKGGIAGPNEIMKIISYMRSCKKLVGRCIYLNILRMTKNEETLKQFMTDGGWKILNKWISEAKETNNEPVLQEILKLLYRLPVTLPHLRENNTPKIVKHFAKSPNAKLRSSASVLMQSWMAIITGTSASAAETEPPKKKKKEKRKVKPETSQKPVAKPEPKATPPVMKAPSFAKFRKTGLETEQVLPKKKSGQPMRKRNSMESDSRIPDKKVKQESKPQKKIMVMEGEGFMDALNSASNPLPITVKKVKRRPLTKPVVSTTSSNKVQLTTEAASGDANDFSATELLRRLSPQHGSSSPATTEPLTPKLNKYGKPMKTVRFKPEEYLESVRYFEVDENERVNVSTQSFKDAQHREMMIERQIMKGGKYSEDSGDGEWRRPSPIEGLDILAVPGCNSVEKDIQTEREKTVLMSIFLSKEMVPETPTEPDPEPYEIIQPRIIPFEDDSAVVESMETDAHEGHSNDVSMKNVPSGMQASDDNLTVKLKQILETASAMQANNNGNNVEQTPTPMEQAPLQQPQQQPMVWNGAIPQGDPNMMMMEGQMPYYPGQPVMIPDPNFYPPHWNPNMGPPRPMFDQNWGARPPWRGDRPMVPSRGRNGFRGHKDNNWRGRWNNGRR